jgi:Raf kinase inhibitor-like YbhB/YbcL family protein
MATVFRGKGEGGPASPAKLARFPAPLRLDAAVAYNHHWLTFARIRNQEPPMNRFANRLRFHAACALSGALFTLCLAGQSARAQSFTISSSTFKDGEMLQTRNAGADKSNPNCVGENVSPPFSWTNVPEGAKSFALLMYDPEGRKGLGVSHWVAYGIPASVTSFAEGEVSGPSEKYAGGKSSRNLPHYFGPCPPPKTGLHHYTFTLIATDLAPDALKPGLTREELFAALKDHALGAAGIVGLFGKP